MKADHARGSVPWASNLALCLLWAAAAAGPSPASAANAESGLREWANGPVRYVMTDSERKYFRGLDTDAERATFVREFWRRRDPDPRTPTNEARLVFWSRVVEANRKFSTPGKPGWRGDRGKIFILLGPPEDVDQDADYQTGITQKGRGVLRWHYYNVSKTTKAHVIVAFTHNGDEDWRLSDDARFASPYFDVNREMYLQSFGVLASASVFDVPWAGSSLDTLMDMGRLQEGPTEADLLRAVVSAEGFLGTYGGVTNADVIPDHEGRPVLLVTTAVRRSEVYPPIEEGAAALAARFAASASVTRPGGGTLDVDETRFVAEPAPDPQDEWVRFQALLPLPPDLPQGRVEVAAVILDRVGGGAAAARGAVAYAPPAPGAPRLAGPFLAQRLTRESDVLPPASRAFRFGEALVTPRMDAVVRAGEAFSIFLEVHGADESPVALAWTITRDGAPWGKPGRVDDGRGIRAWEIKAGSMPAGRYTLEVTAQAAAPAAAASGASPGGAPSAAAAGPASTTRRLDFTLE